MRSEWVPFSAGALVTGVMAMVLAQVLNPGGTDNAPAAQLVVAAESPGRWLAMSILFFFAAVALILGMPSVLLLVADRGRALGVLGVVVFALGCLGVAGLSGIMLMFRALALQTMAGGQIDEPAVSMVTTALEDTGLQIMLNLWIYGFLSGVLLIALALLRARSTPVWVPGLLMAFLAIQLLLPLLGDARVLAAFSLVLLAAGFTGIATNATAPSRLFRDAASV